jgi:1,5-anhydro-D-fructose reductase (1,5-anhydro-D-mannitol-forming)
MIRFGIVGTSGHASRVAAPALKHTPGVVLRGAAGSTPEGSARFAQEHGLPRAYRSLDELLADSDLDAVWICSPNHLHARQIALCAAAGKHVLVEKPLATSSSDAEAVKQAVAQARITLRVGCQHRFRPSHAHIRALITSGAIGRLGYLRIHRFWRYPYFEDMDKSAPPAWRRSPTESGGWIINDIGSHLLDLLLWMSGKQAALAGAVMAGQQFDVATEDSTGLLLRLGQSAIGIVETSCANESPGSRIEAYGSGGWIRADNTLSGAANVTTHKSEALAFTPVGMMDTYASEIVDFIAAIHGEPGIGADASAGAAVTAIIESALSSGMQTRSPLKGPQ